ncbi:MAG: DNA repair protein RecO [Elainella sp. Prado103]|jgi:DNA repair protein RecO (recombination protein O)|nr:DNA repair protein RecO [Elainella sp. Prado103]
MGGTYKTIGINLKSTPLGESDRLLTVLSNEFGLVRMVAPGARKHKSSLGGRSSLFVVNELLVAKGRTLDKIVQAETLESFPGISQNLAKLTAAQYLAELVLFQALSDQSQAELLCLFREHLSRIEQFPADYTLPSLTHATFHLLALAGLTPQLHTCGISQRPIELTRLEPWEQAHGVAFSATVGGLIWLDELARSTANLPISKAAASTATYTVGTASETTGETGSRSNLNQPGSRSAASQPQPILKSAQRAKNADLLTPLDSTTLHLLQQLTQSHFIEVAIQTRSAVLDLDYRQNWLAIERILRQYAQYHFDRPIRSAALIDVCFPLADAPSPCVNHDAIV